jgi:hypothetical protein
MEVKRKLPGYSGNIKLKTMEIEILNRLSKKVAQKTDVKSPAISFNKTGNIYLSTQLVELSGALIGKYVHFIRMDKVWCFFINDDNLGFKLWCSDKRNNAGVVVTSKGICRMLFEQFDIKEQSVRYYVQSKESEYQGHKLYEVLTHRPINKIGQ